MITPARRGRLGPVPPPRVRAREVRQALALELPLDIVRELDEHVRDALERALERELRDAMYDIDPEWGPCLVTVWSYPGGPTHCVRPLRVPLEECARFTWRGERRAA